MTAADAGPLRDAGRVQPVTVVVCCWTEDRWDDLVTAVGSALRQDPPPAEVLLVVDHAPGLLARARDAEGLRGVRVEASDGPRGLSGARNTGVALATQPVVAFLDDDAVAEPGWLAHLVAPYADPAVVGTGGHVEAAWDTGRPRWFPRSFDWVVGCTHRGVPTRRAPVRNPVGASMSFRTGALRAAGGFDAALGRVGSLPVGCEETEASMRVVASRPGSTVVHEPEARVRHRVRAERGRVAYYWRRCRAEGRSKAAVAVMSGQELSVERGHAVRLVAVEVVREAAALLRGDLAGPVRALAVLVGLGATTLGYVEGRARLAGDRP